MTIKVIALDVTGELTAYVVCLTLDVCCPLVTKYLVALNFTLLCYLTCLEKIPDWLYVEVCQYLSSGLVG